MSDRHTKMAFLANPVPPGHGVEKLLVAATLTRFAELF